MAYVKKLFNENFLYYASYVIKDRAIPDEADGLKPVQRRILHSLFEMDDGKFHKVANVVGHCMKYHPHGDASIYGALVVLANKNLFIDRQGNFGNLYTGDQASAARYIECRATSLAKTVFYNPKTTVYADSYDGRNQEPDAFPAKLPVALLIGAEGIAVGMSTKILPHNPLEVIDAEIACLRGMSFMLLPDFPTGGIADCSGYQDGNGKVKVRAKFDFSDPKRILITELPFGSTTESLIESVENAARAGRIKIASISDFTTENVEIEIKLQRGVYAYDIVDALYAFTECEQSVSCSCLLIREGHPVLSSATEIVRRHADSLLHILESELEIEQKEILDEIHARTLERIFIEERVYKGIETRKTEATVVRAVIDGLLPFAPQIGRPVTEEDVARLLKIPIRRISLYDIEKARDELRRLSARLKEVTHHLKHLVEYAVEFLASIRKKLEPEWERKTELASFERVEAKAAAKRNLALRYDSATGYLGTLVSSGERLFDVSGFDRILVVRRSGIFTVLPAPERFFADTGLFHCAIAEKERVNAVLMTIVYRDAKTGCPCIKRCRIEGWILNKDYSLIPEGAQLLTFSVDPDFAFTLKYKPKSRTRVREERFVASSYEEKGLKAAGVRLANREVESVVVEGESGVAAIVAAARISEAIASPPEGELFALPGAKVSGAGKAASSGSAKSQVKSAVKSGGKKTGNPAIGEIGAEDAAPGADSAPATRPGSGSARAASEPASRTRAWTPSESASRAASGPATRVPSQAPSEPASRAPAVSAPAAAKKATRRKEPSLLDPELEPDLDEKSQAKEDAGLLSRMTRRRTPKDEPESGK